jgi:hypothetical protein
MKCNYGVEITVLYRVWVAPRLWTKWLLRPSLLVWNGGTHLASHEVLAFIHEGTSTSTHEHGWWFGLDEQRLKVIYTQDTRAWLRPGAV